MRDIKNLCDASYLMDDNCTDLLQILDALSILDDDLEREGYQPENGFTEWKAIAFAKRFPMYLSALRVVCRDLRRVTDQMDADADRIMDAYKKEAAQ